MGNLFHHFHFHNRHQLARRMLLEAQQAKGATTSKKNADGRGADIADGKVPVNENCKESSSVHNYGSRLIEILMAGEMSKEPERGSSATSASIPATYTDSLSDTDFGDIVSLGEAAGKSSASSLHLSQDAIHAMCEKNSLTENMGWDNPSEERPWIMNSDGHSRHPALDELGKQLLEKHAHLQEKLHEAKEANLNHDFLDAKEPARDMMLHHSKDFVDAPEILNTDKQEFLELLENPNPLAARDTPDKRPSNEEDIVCSSSLINADCSPKKHVNDSKHKMKRKKWFIKFWKDPQDKDSSLNLQPTNLLKDVKQQKKKQDKDRRLDLQNDNSLKDANRMDKGSHSPKCATVQKPASGAPGSNKGLDPSLNLTNKFTGAKSGKSGNRFIVLKHRLKQAIKDGRKEQLHISMDGILHKVPYGTKDIRKETVGKETTANSVNKEQEKTSLDSCPSPSGSIKDDLNERELTSSVTKSDIRDHPTTATILNEGIELTPRISGKDQRSEEPASLRETASKGNERKESYEGDPKNIENMVTEAHGEPESDITHNDNEEKVGSPLMHFTENQHQELGPGTTKITETIPDSIMDCHFEKGNSCQVEDPSSTSTFQDQEGLVTKQMDEFQIKFSDSQEDPCNGAAPHDALAINGVHANQNSVDNDNSDDLYSHSDEDKTDFAYVKDVLRASGLRGDESPTQWHSRDQPMDPLLFDEVESLPTGDINIVTGCNHQLLFDCINEALLEIYERSLENYPWFTSLKSRTRPMPIGKYILDEVWAEINWHLESQSQLSVEYLVERDLARSNCWMDVQAEAKSIVIEFESLILNDLLDDALYQII